MRFSHAVVFKTVVEHTDNSVGPLPCVARFVRQIIDLPRDGFATYPKDSTFPRGQEIDGARLERVRRVVDLLGHVQRIVNDRGQGAGWESRGG